MTISDEIIANDILRTVDEGLKQRPFYKDTREVEEEQTAKGIGKYPNTVNPKDFTLSGWLHHRQQEDYDGLVYTTCALKIAEEMEQQNELMREALEAIFSDTVSWTNPEATIAHIHKVAKEGLGYDHN